MWPIFHSSPRRRRRLGSSAGHQTMIPAKMKLACWREVDEVVAHRALERERQVPAVEHQRVDGDRDERAAQEAEGPAQAPAPGEADQDRARQEESQHRVAQPRQQQRRAEIGEQQVLGHVGAQQVVGERSQRREQRDRLEAQPDVPAGDLGARHGHAAAAEHAQRAHVQPLGDDEPDQDRHLAPVWRVGCEPVSSPQSARITRLIATTTSATAITYSRKRNAPASERSGFCTV